MKEWHVLLDYIEHYVYVKEREQLQIKEIMAKMPPADFMKKEPLPFDKPAETARIPDFLTRNPIEPEERKNYILRR